jgi:hypothetical protein
MLFQLCLSPGDLGAQLANQPHDLDGALRRVRFRKLKTVANTSLA